MPVPSARPQLPGPGDGIPRAGCGGMPVLRWRRMYDSSGCRRGRGRRSEVDGSRDKRADTRLQCWPWEKDGDRQARSTGLGQEGALVRLSGCVQGGERRKGGQGFEEKGGSAKASSPRVERTP